MASSHVRLISGSRAKGRARYGSPSFHIDLSFLLIILKRLLILFFIKCLLILFLAYFSPVKYSDFLQVQ